MELQLITIYETKKIKLSSLLLDLDECGLDKHNCDKKNGICTNVQGSFVCSCASGYEGNGKACTQIDECKRGTHNCHDHGECIDNDGSFACKCKTGFEGDGVSCTGIKKCLRHILSRPKLANVLKFQKTLTSVLKEKLRAVKILCV